VIQPPNLIELQISSYQRLPAEGDPEKQRRVQGLEAVFREVFPIESLRPSRLHARVRLVHNSVNRKNTEIECIRDGITYSVPLYVKLRLREEDFIKDEEIYMGEIPMVTAARLVHHRRRRARRGHPAPPLARASAFEVAPHPNGKLLHCFPNHSGPRHVAGGAVRQQRPALRLSRPPPSPPEVPHHDAAPSDRLSAPTSTSSISSTRSRDLKVSKALDLENGQHACAGRGRD
jgi:hypothetical protein